MSLNHLFTDWPFDDCKMSEQSPTQIPCKELGMNQINGKRFQNLYFELLVSFKL